jgi:hypothetical protein
MVIRKLKKKPEILNLLSFTVGVLFPALEHYRRNKRSLKKIVYLPVENIYR